MVLFTCTLKFLPNVGYKALLVFKNSLKKDALFARER